jgi:hypothetical protein
MLRNYATAIHSRLLILMMLIMFAAPAKILVAQNAEPETTVTDDSETKESKAEKKKEKDKDVIEINERFFISLGIDIAAVLIIILLIYYPTIRRWTRSSRLFFSTL